MADNIFFEASAPGRLDVMGGIADYSGSLVLQMPIKERTHVRVQLRDDYQYSIVSKSNEGQTLSAQGDFRSLLNNGAVDYEYAQQHLLKTDHAWAAYVIGCGLVLQKKKEIEFKGANIFVTSEVPIGKGVSSSAALEVATMKALAQAFNITFQGTELSVLAQQVENNIVGAPCGLMDQLACYFGQPNKFLPIICQPDLVQQPIQIPDDIYFIGIDSGLRHEVSGASYGDVRAAAFMGYSIIAKHLGATDNEIENARVTRNFSSLPYKGYLTNISVTDYEKLYQSILPDSITGMGFLTKYGNTIDPLSVIQENTSYAIQACASHPIYENDRVKKFADHLNLISDSNIPDRIQLTQAMGELMYKAHESYSLCGLGSKFTDELVSYAGTNKNIAGAKITGGGSGGTVCFMAVGEEGKKAVKEIHEAYQRKHNAFVVLFE